MGQQIKERIFGVVNAAALASGGVFPDQAPDSEGADYIVFHSVGGDPNYTLASGSSVRSARFQFDIWSATDTGSQAIKEQLLTLLVGQTDLVNKFKAEPVDLELSDYDADVKLFRAILDMTLWYYP